MSHLFTATIIGVIFGIIGFVIGLAHRKSIERVVKSDLANYREGGM